MLELPSLPDKVGRNAHSPAIDAREILFSDETMRTVFLLGYTAGGSETPDRESAARFLLWFAVEGWKKYQHVTFQPDYLAFLAAPMPPYLSRLAAYVLMSRPELRKRFGADSDRLQAWYYCGGAGELGLAPLIGAREQALLREAHPIFVDRPDPPTRLEYYGYLQDDALSRRYDIRQEDQRATVLAHLRAPGRRSAPGWLADAPADLQPALPGVNIVGFGNSIMGIGEDVRALASVLGHAGVPRSIYNVTLPDRFGTSRRQGIADLHVDRPIFPVNIFALPAFETARLHVEHGAQLFHRRYSIGYWPWELTSLPAHWHGVFDLVDEVWASSEFLLDVYRRLTKKPVIYMPPYLNIPEPAETDLGIYGIEADAVVFLAMFDFNSFVARKNPEGAIAAFQAAFPDIDGPERLLVKTLNAHSHAQAFKQLQERIGDDERIALIDGALSRGEIAGLIASVDCLISLHRSEGFGRVLAEAMALGTTVVATDWSGNTSFLDATRGYPVRFTLRDVKPGEYVFSQGSQWAEPSIEDAAIKLRLARDNLPVDGERKRRARNAVETLYGLDAVSLNVADRLHSLI